MPPAPQDLTPFFTALTVDVDPTCAPSKRGPKPKYKRDDSGMARPMTTRERTQRARAGKKADKLRHIAVLDFETDPFDEKTKSEILPFVCELYSDQFGSIVIWEEDFERFVAKVYNAIESLPDSYTIYAHNGGKFDYMFLVSKLRGVLKFKGRAIMSARIGNHELRDSLHILPEKLAAWKKDHFDYSKMTRCNRGKYRAEILAYLHSDCIYLFDIIRSFVDEFGLKISIGQAAFSRLKASYPSVENIPEASDAFLRRYFFGGRVECISGRGLFDSATGRQGFKLYDVNSAYPRVMADRKHPIGSEYNWRRGGISENTIFIDVECRNNGAFVSREKDDPLSASVGNKQGRFYTTIWEYNVAKKYGLIEDDHIVGVVDCNRFSDFSDFILPMYQRKAEISAAMDVLEKAGKSDTVEYEELKKQRIFLKYLLNNGFGKFAQNPRNFKEYYYTETGEAPPREWMEWLEHATEEERHKFGFPIERTDEFSVWAKPSPGRRYNNVGTAASITGAQRAVLLEAIQHATEPLYCDTDSLICRDLKNVEMHVSNLGAWKLEAEFDRVIIAGRKLYACEVKGYPDGHDKRVKIRSKGASGLTWSDFEKMLDDHIIETINKAPTISKTGKQDYLRRRIRATAPVLRRTTNARGILSRAKSKSY